MAPGIIRHCVLHDTSCYTMRFYYSRPTRFCCQISSGAPGQATSGVRLDTRTLKFRKYLTIGSCFNVHYREGANGGT